MVLDELVVRQCRHPQLHTHLEEGEQKKNSSMFRACLKSRKNYCNVCPSGITDGKIPHSDDSLASLANKKTSFNKPISRAQELEMETYQHVEPLSAVLCKLSVSLRSSLKHEENGNGVPQVWGGGVQTSRRCLGHPCYVREGEKRERERNEGGRETREGEKRERERNERGRETREGEKRERERNERGREERERNE